MNWFSRLFGREQKTPNVEAPLEEPRRDPAIAQICELATSLASHPLAGDSFEATIAQTCGSLDAYELPKLLNMAKTHLNMRGWMEPSTLERIIAATGALLERDVNNPGAIALLGYATLAMHRPHDGMPHFERARAQASGKAATCGHYFHALSAFRMHALAADSEAAGKALVDGLLQCTELVYEKTTLYMDRKSLELGHCIIVSTDLGGQIVPVQGHEEYFAQRF